MPLHKSHRRSVLCGQIDTWMGGAVSDLSTCSAFLCPTDTYASEGRATESESCKSCPGNEFYGSTKCAGSSSGSGTGGGDSGTSTDANTREALIEMYNTMGGRFWKKSDNWLNPGRPVCEWYGIICDDDGDYVTGINMKDNDLEGTFPSALFSLEKLNSINLSGNSIDFPFDGIEAAKALEFLDLTHTDLTSIEGIKSLSETSIKRLKLTSNYLQGTVPTAFFQLVTLEELAFSHNKFEGPLPPQVGDLTNLQRLKLYGNNVSGNLPTQLGLLTNLVELDLSENAFGGPLPSELNKLVKLEKFSLHQTGSTGLTGNLLSFQDLTQLTSLQLDSNMLDGDLPSSFLSNTQVGDQRIEIRLSDNAFSGAIPSAWETRFDNLFLDLSGNKITSIPSDLCDNVDWMDGMVQEYGCATLLCPKSTYNEFGRQTDAESVCRTCNRDSEPHLGRKSCTEEDESEETDLTILKEFYYATAGAGWIDSTGWLDTNDYCSWFGVECNEDDEVTKLSLPSNGLTGTPKSSVFDLSALVELDLQENTIDFSFDGIGRAIRLETLHLSSTNLDSIHGISESKSLRILHLTQNELGGPIPAELFDMTSLKKLFMNYNQFSGRIPNRISAWTNLEELYLLHNRLEGQIPAAIGELTNLRVLSLSENSLTGTMPVELGDLEKIEILAIQREDGTAGAASSPTETGFDQQQSKRSGLRGNLPPLDKLKHLQELYLGENSLEGTIPVNFLNGVLDKQSEITVDLVSNQLEGEIPAALAGFKKMKLFLADNKISDIADGICQKDDWMGGEVDSVGCDAILCPPGTANRFGREHSGGLSCQSCSSAEDAPYYGMFSCLSEEDQTIVGEGDILKDFFEKAGGRQWQTNTGWLSDSNSFCQWHGVTCTTTDPVSVAAIHLSNNGLTGYISSSLWILPSLAELNVAGNDVKIQLEGIENSNLVYLNLDQTGISSLDNLSSTNLQLLHATDNKFSSFPTEILGLQNLEVLFLSNNEIEELPDSVGAMQTLRFLACDECGLKGQLPLWVTSSLTNLEYASFRQNAFAGTVPDMTALTGLKHIDIGAQRPHGGGLTGQVSDLATLTHLVEVAFDGNKLTGPIPQAFLQNVADVELITVDLRNNEITGSIPETLATRFTRMNLLLGNNQITSVPASVCAKNWNGGKVGSSCDHILCSAGTYNLNGHASTTQKCNTCADASSSFLGATSCGDTSEQATLETIYMDLGSTAWTNHDNWGTSPDVCSWYGIECHEDDGSAASGKVKSIVLEDNNLVGTLKSSVYQLEYLESIFVKQNEIDVEFDGVASASNLNTLHLSQTNVKSIAGLGVATSLQALHLTGNEITGTIPAEVFKLTNLVDLYLNYNQFDGTLSKQISKLSNLKEFYLFHNHLTGTVPTEVGALVDIEVLGLGENGFHGTLPTELNTLKFLRVLSLQKEKGDFSTEGITGTLPALNKLEDIRELYLGGNSITGTLPSNFLFGIVMRSSTITIDLVDNQITGEVPETLDVFYDLRLYLAGNQISSVPDKICGMVQWMDGLVAHSCDGFLCPPGTFNEFGRRISDESECFPCSVEEDSRYYGSTSCGADAGEDVDERTVLFQLYNELGGNDWNSRDNWKEDNKSVCTWFGVKCADGSEVTDIELPRNGLKGTVPPSIFHLKSLRTLNLQENDVEFTFEGIGLTPALEELNMGHTKARSLSGIDQLQNLRTLNMAENHFSTSLPKDLFKLSSLEKLFITNAGFIGSIPGDIGAMTKLSVLFMNHNELTGTLPSEIGMLTSVSVLQVSENLLYGSVPTEINKMKALKSLFADSFTRPGAGFSGPLPAFDQLPNLRELALGSNTFTGAMPSSFLEGVTVTDEKITIGLHANQLTGAVPSSLSRFELIYLDVAANRISTLPESFCSKSKWNEGKVGEYGCDALLCPAGTYNEEGKQGGEDTPCLTCPNIPSGQSYLGSTGCLADQKKQEREILEKLFESTSGLKWKDMTGWLSENDICTWYGVSCTSSGTVESLLLGSNNLHGSVPSDIFGGLPDLMYLWLYSNPISFKFDKIGEAKKLNSLLIDSTGLTSLEGVGSASALTDLDVRFNNLEGTVPTEIANLRDLSSFACGNNRLGGTIPSFNGNRKLKTLRMGSNNFDGQLPDFATNPALETLDLSQNNLLGSIPVSLLANSDTENEIFIDLSDNQLTGTVPGELTRFDKVRLFLRDNMFSGIDTGLCGKLDWLEGDVGSFGCNGIMCPPSTYGPTTGRASSKDGGQQCLSCPEESYYGSTTCGGHKSSALRRSVSMAVTVLALSAAALIVL